MKKIFMAAILFVFAVFANAQVANNTQLVGTVTDASGAVVSGASVTATNVATKVEYKGTTNAEGFYTIPYVLPGTYNIAVESAGFTKTIANGAEVLLNQSARTDFTMKVGDSGSEVTVNASTAVLSTDDALIGETITSKQAENLPMASRRVMELATTASNVIIGPKTNYTGVPPGVSFIGAGTREVSNSMTLDGITIMNSLISTSPVTPNPDAIGAVQVQTGNYTAQYGAYMGVHINSDTKSGTNNFHGTIYDYIQNDIFNAKAFVNSSTDAKPVLRFNQFGGEIGGPILRDRAFFMGSYEGLRQIKQVATLGQTLTDKMRTGDFSELGKTIYNPATGEAYANAQVTNINPIAQVLLDQYYPKATSSGLTKNIGSNVPTVFNKNSTLDRIDYAVNDRVRLFGRYMWEKSDAYSGSLVPTSATTSPTTVSNGIFGYTHIITPNLVNDFRIGYNKFQSNQLNYFQVSGLNTAGTDLGITGFTADTANNNPGIPTFQLSGGYLSLGAEGTNWYQDDRTIHGYDQISWTKGKHTIMAGADIRRMAIGRSATNQNRGQFTFSGQYSSDAAVDFLTGYSNNVVTPLYQVRGTVASWRNGYFIQDTWQASPRLTVQYGVRYEQPTVPYSLNGIGRILNSDYTALIPTSTATSAADYTPAKGFKFHDGNHNLWAPRLGLSFRATDKIVFRAGGGIYYNPNHLNAFTLSTSNYPFASSATYSGPDGTDHIGTLNLSDPSAGQASSSKVPGVAGTYQSAFTVNHYLPTPRMYQWNADTGVELWKGAGFEMQYLGSKSVNLDYSYYPNQPTPGPGDVNARRPYQLFGQIRQIQNGGFMTYNGLTTIFRQRGFHGLDTNLSYTWSHTMDTSNDANGGGTSMIQNNLRADYGDANWDIRHRFVGTVTYAMPELRGHMLNTFAGGWHINTIVTLQSGQPMNVGITEDRAYVGGVGTQRPDFVKQPTFSCSKQNYINKTSCIDISAYSLPGMYTFGNLHRNDLKGPGSINTDLSLFKDFAVWKTMKLQLRAEAFNVFNHANLANPTNLTLPSVVVPAGETAPAGSKFTQGTSSFGQITSVVGSSRVLQLAGKINF